MSVAPASASCAGQVEHRLQRERGGRDEGDLLGDRLVLADRPAPLHPLGRPLAGDLQRTTCPPPRTSRGSTAGRCSAWSARSSGPGPRGRAGSRPAPAPGGSRVTPFSMPRRPMNALRRSTVMPGRVGLDDERGDAAAAAVVLRAPAPSRRAARRRRRWWSTASRRRAGRPSPSSVGVAVVAIRAGSEPTSGSVSRNARDRARGAARQELAASAPRCRTASPAAGTPIDWCADSSAPMLGCTEPTSISARP